MVQAKPVLPQIPYGERIMLLKGTTTESTLGPSNIWCTHMLKARALEPHEEYEPHFRNVSAAVSRVQLATVVARDDAE